MSPRYQKYKVRQIARGTLTIEFNCEEMNGGLHKSGKVYCPVPSYLIHLSFGEFFKELSWGNDNVFKFEIRPINQTLNLSPESISKARF